MFPNWDFGFKKTSGNPGCHLAVHVPPFTGDTAQPALAKKGWSFAGIVKIPTKVFDG
jgi:hypothetical protein